MASPGRPTAADAPAQPSEEELRELMMRGEQLRQQLGQLENQREYLIELLTDARRSHMTLEHAITAKDGEEILIPLGAGAYLQGRLAHGGKALASLGAGIHAEMPAGDARDRMKARIENLETAAGGLGKDIGRVSDEMARLNALAESFYG